MAVELPAHLPARLNDEAPPRKANRQRRPLLLAMSIQDAIGLSHLSGSEAHENATRFLPSVEIVSHSTARERHEVAEAREPLQESVKASHRDISGHHIFPYFFSQNT